MILNFLTRFVEEADIIGMTEAQALVAIPNYLVDSAETQFRASIHGARSGGITSYPEAIQYLLRTYATPSALREAVNAVRDVKQQAGETENAYNIRLNNACDRCGNAFDQADKMTFFVNGLMDSIRSIVARFRESMPRGELTYTDLVSYAQDEGDAHRARFSGLRILRTSKSTTLPTKRELQPKTSSRGAHFLEVGTTHDSEEAQDILVLPEDSVPTSELPSTVGTSTTNRSEEQLLMTGIQRTPPAPLAFGDRNSNTTRVGWVDRQPTVQQRIICYTCYKPGHTSPQCTARMADMNKIMENYEALSASDKERIPDYAYKAAKTYIEAMELARIDNDVKKEVGNNNTQQSKN